MSRTAPKVVLLVVMIATIVGMDLAFFRGSSQTGARLIANIAAVLVFGALYFILFGRKQT